MVTSAGSSAACCGVSIRNLSDFRRIGNFLYGYGHSKAGRSKHACGIFWNGCEFEERIYPDCKIGLSLASIACHDMGAGDRETRGAPALMGASDGQQSWQSGIDIPQ
jgi:hypothetical protein